MTIEISIKKKKLNISTTNLVNYQLPIHEKLQKVNPNDLMMDFDGTSLYPSAMWHEKYVYTKVEPGFAFKPHMNNVHVEAFNDQTFDQDGNESAILKIKYYNPPDLMFQHLPIKETIKNIELRRLRNGYITDTLTPVDIQERVTIGRKVFGAYEGVIYRENFTISSFRTNMEKLFAFRQKLKEEHYGLMQCLIKSIMNSLYGVRIRKDNNESFKCNPQKRMETEYDENVLDYWKFPNGNYIVKLKKTMN